MNTREILEQHKIWVRSAGKKGIKANLNGADLKYKNLSDTDLSDADLSNADLRYANLSGIDLIDTNLSGADLRYADLCCANLSKADLNGADLRNANLSNARLSSANLSGSYLRNANLSGVCLSKTNLSNTNLSSTNLSGAYLIGAYFPESPIIILGETYSISITNGESVRVGCQCHSINEWRKFSKKEIAEMDGKTALRFYPRLLDIIDFYCGKGERPDWLEKE